MSEQFKKGYQRGYNGEGRTDFFVGCHLTYVLNKPICIETFWGDSLSTHTYLAEEVLQLFGDLLSARAGLLISDEKELKGLLSLLPAAVLQTLAEDRDVNGHHTYSASYSDLRLWYSPNKLTVFCHSSRRTFRVWCLSSWGKGDSIVSIMSACGTDWQRLSSPEDFCRALVKSAEMIASRVGTRFIPSPTHFARLLIGSSDFVSLRTNPKVRGFFHSSQPGPWAETFQKGSFLSAYDYDFTDAYAREVANLPILRSTHGYWRYVTAFNRSATLGIYEVDFTLDPAVATPIRYFPKGGFWAGSFSVYGRRTGLLTHDEVTYILEGRGKIHSLRGHAFFLMTEDYPLRERVLYLVEKRREFKECADVLGSLICKMVMVRIPGIFYSVDDDGFYTEPFNPAYYALVTSRLRLKVGRLVENREDLILVNVDGFALKTALTAPHPYLEEVGSGPALIYNHNIRAIGGTATAIDPRWIVEKDPEGRTFGIGRVGLKEEDEMTFAVNTPGSRFWPVSPKRNKDLLTGNFESSMKSVEDVKVSKLERQLRESGFILKL
ncbi:hypothetical protein LCGC14_1155930 [marine sediment metagenome]|uniref:Uncharacterized protein n=1 Tax=marine sediment metagenome TaxID=412755 RepID=A0A0F9LYX9_9ZZZZ